MQHARQTPALLPPPRPILPTPPLKYPSSILEDARIISDCRCCPPARIRCRLPLQKSLGSISNSKIQGLQPSANSKNRSTSLLSSIDEMSAATNAAHEPVFKPDSDEFAIGPLDGTQTVFKSIQA